MTPLFRALPIPVLLAWLCLAPLPAHTQSLEPAPIPGLSEILDDAAALGPLETVIVSRDGQTIAERGYRGHSVTQPTNIKSASKTIISAMVGIAIDRGLLDGIDQPIAGLLQSALPADPDPLLEEITIGNLLSMQAGLQRTSGANYGRWVVSANWVRYVLSRPFEDVPGGAMLYSTGSSHLLSAILTAVGGQSSLALARDWFGAVDGFAIAGWDRDPQGIYFGGNQLAMTPRSLLAFGEIYRNGGRNADGEQIISQDWIDQSFQPRTNSRFSGDGYGYGWYLRTIAGADVAYGWGYGGQMLYIVPEFGLTVVMTSDENTPSGRTGHRQDLHDLLGEIIDTVRQSSADRATPEIG